MMQVGKAVGMVTLNDALMDLVTKKLVAPEEAYAKAIDKAGMEPDDEAGRVSTRQSLRAGGALRRDAAGAAGAARRRGRPSRRSRRACLTASSRLHGSRTPCYIRQVLLELGHPI